tara:strand:+ start:311 stop:526 length:216 start_codon:yes stop_codon:yes gene_type:complete
LALEDPIESSLEIKFYSEKLSRTIQECNDIDLLREIATQLLLLNMKKTAIADWATKRAAEADYSKIIDYSN